MTHHRLAPYRVAVGLLILLSAARWAGAQTSSALILGPWEEGRVFEIDGQVLIQGETDTRDALSSDVDLQWYSAVGRYRFTPEDRFGPTLGLSFEHIEFSSSHPMVPDRLVDVSIGFGTGLAKFDWGGLLVTGAIGFAGDQPFSDDDALYGRANLIAAVPIDDDKGWQFAINYDGNRTLWPDIPVPTVNWYHRVSDELFYAVGTMYNVLRWTPNDSFRLIAAHQSPFTVDVVAEYLLFEGLWVQGGFHNRFNAYHIDGDVDDRRVFFAHRRLEAGIHWTPSPSINITVAGGWAFGQELERGWDSRDLTTVVELDDAPYIRVGGELTF